MIETIKTHRFSVVDAVLLFGLLGSGFFTAMLFLDIYGWDNFLGWFTGLMALGLFEFGAYGWRIGFVEAHGDRQRLVAGVGMFVCSALSVASTVIQIIMSSKLWVPSWDEGAWTIAILAVAFAMNVIGGQLWELWSPKVQATVARQQLADAKEHAQFQEQIEKLQFDLDMAGEQRRVDLARTRMAYQRSFDSQRKRLDGETTEPPRLTTAYASEIESLSFVVENDSDVTEAAPTPKAQAARKPKPL